MKRNLMFFLGQSKTIKLIPEKQFRHGFNDSLVSFHNKRINYMDFLEQFFTDEDLKWRNKK